MTTKGLSGSLLAIPTVGDPALAKVIFQSTYFSKVIAIKLFIGTRADAATAVQDAETKPYEIYYTDSSAIKSKRWNVLDRVDVTENERAQTKRVVGGEVWVEDQHLGVPSDSDIKLLPDMRVHGYKLIEKYAGRGVN